MWYPSQEQQQQYRWYGHIHHPSSQQQQTYSTTSYYCNDDELSTTSVVAINGENESPVHCQIANDSHVHVTTADCYVITSNSSYGDEMSSYQTIPIRKPYWSPVIAAPSKSTTSITPSLPAPSSPSSPSSSSASACWDWLLFSPQYYSEFYTPSSTFVHYQKIEEEETDDTDWNFQATLPTCLLALLYLTPNLIHTSDDENETDREISSLHRSNACVSSSIEKKNHHHSNSNITGQINRSSTPDTDDGYQSASDASRSDYSQQSSVPLDHRRSNDDITIHKHPLPAPLMPRRISYAAAAKPTVTSSFPPVIGRAKQTMNHSFSTNITTNDISNSNGQKLKFTAPRFERMHHAKQSTSSNRTQIRTNNTNNQRTTHPANPTRRR